MTQAIITRYLGPTNTRGSRIKATCYAGSTTVPFSYDCETETAHARAAQALCEKLGWKGAWVAGGATPDGRGNAYVQSRNEPPAFVL